MPDRRTLGAILAQDENATLHFRCNRIGSKCHIQRQITNKPAHRSAKDMAAKLGLNVVVEQIERAGACSVCGARWPYVGVEVVIHRPGFSAGGYRQPD